MAQNPSRPSSRILRIQRRCTPDEGASEVIGSILLVGITVVVTVAFVAIAFGALDDEPPAPITELSHQVDSGDDVWGNGDEYVSVLHRGGQALAQDQFVVVVRIADGDEVRYADGTANPVDPTSQDAFSPSDDLFTIGERWRTPDVTIGEQTAVDVAAAGGGGGGHLLSSGVVRSGTTQVTTYSYVQTPLDMVIGTSSNDDNTRSADDGGAAATLTEALTGSTTSTEDLFGTASSGTATNPSNAEDAPDDTYALLDADGEHVQVSGYPTDSGTITKVELALEGKHDGGTDRDATDVVELSHNLGTTTQTYALTTTDSQHFLDVTADRAWTWSDIENLAVRATCQCRDHPSDAKVFSIDTLWVRVTADTDVYELETDAWTFDPLDSGSTHTLELRYRTVGPEDYLAQVWDGSFWTTRATLDQGTFTTATHDLTSGEIDAGPQIRILDASIDDTRQGELELDYVRVGNNP